MTRFFWIGCSVVLVIICAAGGIYWRLHHRNNVVSAPVVVTATTTPVVIAPVVGLPVEVTVGTSVQGRVIKSYTYGTGTTTLLFVGGIHGGYEWNGVYLAYRFMDYLQANPSAIPANLSIAIIPSANPDGVFKIVGVEGRFAVENVPNAPNPAGVGRFNAHGVDLNRNFGCKWQPESTWQGKTVNAGTAAFSEPEAAAIRDYVVTKKPAAAIFWHSAANAVYASECKDGVLPATVLLMKTYATAAKYKAVASFNAYPVTGDAEGWMASVGIPAITVELSTHDTTDWERNLSGFLAVLATYRK